MHVYTAPKSEEKECTKTHRTVSAIYNVSIFLIIHVASRAVFEKLDGSSRHKVSSVTQSQVVDIERKNDTAQKLAIRLILLLFIHEELSRGNCTKTGASKNWIASGSGS